MMEKNAKIYVAGHRGMVGSAIVRELERQGYTYTQSGLGTFVSDKKEISVDKIELEKGKERLDDAVKQLKYMGLSNEEIEGIFNDLMSSSKGGILK